MAIITLETVKKLLQITDNSKDSTITELIPVVQSFVCTYCKNYFEVSRGKSNYYSMQFKTNFDKTFWIESYSISFAATGKKIIDSGHQFVDAGFLAGAHVRVQNSVLNDGIYKISSVSTGELVVAEALQDEPEGNTYIKLSVVVFPQGIQLPVAKLIAYELNKKNNEGIQSESLADYSVTLLGGDYPKSLLAGLNAFRKIGSTC